MGELKEIQSVTKPKIKIATTRLFWFKKDWHIRKLTLGKLFQLSECYIKIKYESVDNAESDDRLALQMELVRENAPLCAEIVATATDSILPKWFLKRHFLKNLTPKELRDFAENMLKQSDYGNFMISIVLMNGNRITKPKNTVED